MKYRSCSLLARTCEMPSSSIVTLAASCRPARRCGVSANTAALIPSSRESARARSMMIPPPEIIGFHASTEAALRTSHCHGSAAPYGASGMKQDVAASSPGNSLLTCFNPRYAAAWSMSTSRLQRTVKKGKRHVHPIVDVGMIVVEFLVSVRDARLVQALREDTRAVVDVELVAPAAVDVDAAQRSEVALVAFDEPRRVVPLPLPPALRKHFAGLEVERQAKAVGRCRIRIVGRRHAQVHDAVPLGHRQLRLLPHGREEPLHAPVVQAAPGGLRSARRVVASRLLSSRAVLRQLVQGVRPIVPVDEVEIRVTRMVGDRAPGRGVLHAVKHRAVAPGGFAEAAPVIARSERAELAVDKWHELSRQIVGVAADRARVPVLVAAERREAIGE